MFYHRYCRHHGTFHDNIMFFCLSWRSLGAAWTSERSKTLRALAEHLACDKHCVNDKYTVQMNMSRLEDAEIRCFCPMFLFDETNRKTKQQLKPEFVIEQIWPRLAFVLLVLLGLASLTVKDVSRLFGR